jgi:hypothetical protein
LFLGPLVGRLPSGFSNRMLSTGIKPVARSLWQTLPVVGVASRDERRTAKIAAGFSRLACTGWPEKDDVRQRGVTDRRCLG